MGLTRFSAHRDVVRLLQQSLQRDRLGHGYLFSGPSLLELESVAMEFGKLLNCENRIEAEEGRPDACDECPACGKMERGNFGDVRWVRAESKMRLITIDQMRALMGWIHLKPSEGRYKVGVISGADRMNVQAANSFLKTLEEPPPMSVLILLTTELDRVLETVVSRCLRLNFGGEQVQVETEWLGEFARLASVKEGGVFGRYRLLGVFLDQLKQMREVVETEARARSPLEQYEDVDERTRDRWEEELAAAIEAEYRRRRGELMLAMQLWLRDVWLRVAGTGVELAHFPQLAEWTGAVASRVGVEDALENLSLLERTQRLLHTNVQEALTLEVSMLKLRL